MAVLDEATTTGAARQGDLKRRNVPGETYTNGYIPTELDSKLDEKTKQKTNSFLKTLDDYEYILAPLLFTALAFFTRMYKIGAQNSVIWDEAHFGKFGSHYLKREFYFDVHPPMAKMLVGLSGYIAGYNGSWDWKSGETFPEELNYTAMRVFNAVPGALLVPLAYYTARELHFKRPTVWLIALMTLCETSWTAISRFVLLDSMLLFFTFLTVFCWAKFHNQRSDPFSPAWGLWLFATGLSIGCVCSVKWVGMFGTALVGIYTVDDLWSKFGNTRMPKVEFAAHVGFRVIGLILIPVAVYMFNFYLHFLILENSGPGDAQMSSLFQANLKGTEVGKDSPLEVALGSRATLKNMGYGGGLLHSHVQTFPEGSQQQQITCYHHKDANNDWFFYPNRGEQDYDVTDEVLRFPGHKDTIRLIHAQTGRNLHSHQVAAPVTTADYEVSCYGNTTVGDTKDHWIIEVVKDAASSDHSKIRTLTTAFRLRHADLNCYLRAGNVNLPQWGFKQIETTCVKENKPRDVFTHWNVESHWNDKLPAGDPGSYKSPFLWDFIHLNVAMMTSNNALVPDPDKQDDLASAPWQWPLLHVGLRMCGWDDHNIKYFLLGNPAVYWGSTFSLVFFMGMVVWYAIRWQRGYDELTWKQVDHFHYSGIYPVLGWFLHYLPFLAMARVTYVHHYYPALYFAVLCAGFVLDWYTRDLRPRVQWPIFAVLYTVVIYLFWLFRAFCFGMEGNNHQWDHLKWLPSWRMVD